MKLSSVASPPLSPTDDHRPPTPTFVAEVTRDEQRRALALTLAPPGCDCESVWLALLPFLGQLSLRLTCHTGRPRVH